jgi:hypothetical protein
MSETKILRDEFYRCRICEKKCHKELNSYIHKITPKIHIRICRHCWLRINKYLALVEKIKNPVKS